MTQRVAAVWFMALIAVAGNVWAAGQPPVAEPTPDRPLTLEEGIRIAFQRHGDIGVAQQDLFGAHQRVTSARASLFPQAEANVTERRTNTKEAGGRVTREGIPIPGRTTHQLTHQYSISGSQLLWDMGQTRMQLRQTKAGVLSAEAGLGLARTTVAFDVANTYFEQLRREKLLALAEQQVKQAEERLKMVQAQVEAGVSAKIDLQPVLVTVSQAKYNLLVAKNNARVAATNFRNALGLDRGPALKLEDVPSSVPSSVSSLEEYLAEAERTRPDLQQAQASVLQAEASHSLARIRARPLVSIRSDYTWGLGDSPTQRDLFLFGTLTVPLFNAGSLRAQVRESRADLEANKIRLQQLRKDVSANVEAAYSNLVSAVERIAAARALVDEAQANFDAATEKYKLGVGIALEIVEAQVQLFDAQISATEALYDYHIAKAALDRAIGTWAYERQAKQEKKTATR